jgi:hypothetical protein
MSLQNKTSHKDETTLTFLIVERVEIESLGTPVTGCPSYQPLMPYEYAPLSGLRTG